jgi:hypothetical protein
MRDLMGFPPKVFIIGAQKSGTTQLAELLDQHSDICLSSPKEPDYFTRFYDKGLDWYKHCFADSSKCLIDASTSYTCRPLPNVYAEDHNFANHPLVGVPEKIHQLSPDAKLIYIVRDPVKRTYSGYWHQIRSGVETDTMDVAVFKNTYYRRISKYAEQLEYYLEYFKPEQILLLDFDKLIKSPQEQINICLEFIGLPALAELQSDLHKNKSFQYSGPLNVLNVKLAKYGGLGAISQVLKKLLPLSLVDWLKEKTAKPIPKLTDEETAMLNEQFEDEVAKVKALLERAQRGE